MSETKKVRTQIIRLSEMPNLVRWIYDLRHPEKTAEHDKALAEYIAALEDKPEVTGKTKEGMFIFEGKGFYELKDGKPVFTPRPEKRCPKAYVYYPYMRGFWSAHSDGLLTKSRYNRDIRPDRVAEYVEAMNAGKWEDLLSDPITITDEGQVVNGQHRIAAACQAKPPNDPHFMVIWGVEGREATLTDGSKRTDRDHATILEKVGRAA